MEERRKDDVELRERLVVLETQMGRLVSDAESEKDTRRRVADAINARFIVSDERLRNVEQTIWKAAGAITVISALVVVIVNVIMKHL